MKGEGLISNRVLTGIIVAIGLVSFLMYMIMVVESLEKIAVAGRI